MNESLCCTCVCVRARHTAAYGSADGTRRVGRAITFTRRPVEEKTPFLPQGHVERRLRVRVPHEAAQQAMSCMRPCCACACEYVRVGIFPTRTSTHQENEGKAHIRFRCSPSGLSVLFSMVSSGALALPFSSANRSTAPIATGSGMLQSRKAAQAAGESRESIES